MNDFVIQVTNTGGDILGSLLALGVFAAGIWVLIMVARQPGYQDLVGSWCTTRQLRLVGMERRWLFKGPFFLNPNGTAVFYLTVHDPLGFPQHYWARCGHWLFGMLAPEIHVLPAD